MTSTDIPPHCGEAVRLNTGGTPIESERHEITRFESQNGINTHQSVELESQADSFPDSNGYQSMTLDVGAFDSRMKTSFFNINVGRFRRKRW